MTLVIYNGSYFSPRRSLLCPKHAKNDSFCTKKKEKKKRKKKNNNNNTIRIFMEKNYSIKTCQWKCSFTFTFFCCISPETISAFARKSSIQVHTDRILNAVVRAKLALVNIHTLFPVSRETFSTDTLVWSICVEALNTLCFKVTGMLFLWTLVNVLAGSSISFEAFIAVTFIALVSIDTGSQGFVALVDSKFAFVGKYTAFNPITIITLLALALVSTNSIHTPAMRMTWSTFLWEKNACFQLKCILYVHLICYSYVRDTIR